ncbi:MAG TPA: M10 family metallopeptidase C-terminal domain-containing protein, partial [Thermodesulfovibrionia bacterium]|nr:M10 family metallopeptidase C-terminal domain-containing protein [Thermodesulfovibrionia bacterium]
TINGGEGNDTINGGEGNDAITGSKGNDSIYGNNGNDTFVLASGEGIDTIEDFEKGIDRIKLSDDLSFNDLTFTTTSSVEISITATGEVLAVVKGVEQLDPDDFIFIDDKKVKFTFYHQEGVTEKDSLRIAGSMKPKLVELPFDKDVTVAVSVVDSQNNKHKLFTQLVPDGTVEGTKKYHFKSKESGVEKLKFKQRKDSTDFKVSVDMVDFLSANRSEMSPDEYLAFVKGIKSYIITIDIDGEGWSGSAPIEPGRGNKKKQVLKSHR